MNSEEDFYKEDHETNQVGPKEKREAAAAYSPLQAHGAKSVAPTLNLSISNIRLHTLKVVGSVSLVLRAAKRLVFQGGSNVQMRDPLVQLLSRPIDHNGQKNYILSTGVPQRQHKPPKSVKAIYAAPAIEQIVTNVSVKTETVKNPEARGDIAQLNYDNISILSSNYVEADARTGFAHFGVIKICPRDRLLNCALDQTNMHGMLSHLYTHVIKKDYQLKIISMQEGVFERPAGMDSFGGVDYPLEGERHLLVLDFPSHADSLAQKLPPDRVMYLYRTAHYEMVVQHQLEVALTYHSLFDPGGIGFYKHRGLNECISIDRTVSYFSNGIRSRGSAYPRDLPNQ